MDYEKAYKEALERCKKEFDFSNLAYSHEEIKQKLEHIFPELKENEDEKIRKELIRDIDIAMPIETAQRYIAWLEKQGGKVDVLDDFPTEFERQISHLIASSINKEWEYKKDFVKHTANALLQYAKNELEKQGEQNPTIQYNYVKFREGDTVQKITGDKDIVTIAEVDTKAEVYRLTNTGFIPFKYEHLWHIVEQKSTWSEEDEKKTSLSDYDLSMIDNLVTDENCPLDSEYISWLKSLKDRFQLQPKQEWSEADEQMLTRIIDEMEAIKSNSSTIFEKNIAQEKIDWLKSLIKPQNKWKPSEDQMEALVIAVHDAHGRSYYEKLFSIYNDLKSL